MKSASRSGRTLILRSLLFSFVFITLVCVSITAQAEDKKVKVRQNDYYYSAFNKKDPFASLIVGQFKKNKRMSSVDLLSVELVGVVKGDLDRFGLLEDENGFSYILRVGDMVKNGRVVAIGEKSLVARVTNFGQTKKYTLHLNERREGDKR